MFSQIFNAARRALGSIMEPPVTRESLAKSYSEMPDSQLRALANGPLTPMAREAAQAEFARRAQGARREGAERA